MRGIASPTTRGFFNAGVSTHEPFDPEVVEREMRVIHNELHGNAVRITGGVPDRLEIAARHAAAAGLEVWLSPFTCELTRCVSPAPSRRAPPTGELEPVL